MVHVRLNLRRCLYQGRQRLCLMSRTKASVLLNCLELSPNIFLKRRKMYHVHITTFFGAAPAFIWSKLSFPKRTLFVFFIFFRLKNLFLKLSTNQNFDLISFQWSVVEKFLSDARLAKFLTSIASWKMFSRFLVRFSFVFVFVLLCFAFHFLQKPKFISVDTDVRKYRNWNWNWVPTIGTKIFFCVRTRKTNQGGGKEREVVVCVCVC